MTTSGPRWYPMTPSQLRTCADNVAQDPVTKAALHNAAARIEELLEAFDELLNKLPPDFPRAYYDEITARGLS